MQDIFARRKTKFDEFLTAGTYLGGLTVLHEGSTGFRLFDVLILCTTEGKLGASSTLL